MHQVYRVSLKTHISRESGVAIINVERKIHILEFCTQKVIPQSEREIKTSLDKQKLKKFVTSRSAGQEMPEILHSEGKWHRLEMNLHKRKEY